MADPTDPSASDPSEGAPESAGELAALLSERLRVRVGQLVKGAADDVKRYAAAVAVDLAYAAATGDDEMARHLRAQARALAEAHRLQLAGESWSQVSELVYGLAEGARLALAAA